MEDKDLWGFVLKVDESSQTVEIYDRLLDYIKTVPVSSVKKVNDGVESFKTSMWLLEIPIRVVYQQEKVNNVVNPNLSSVDSFQAPICPLDSLIPAEYEEIPSLEVSPVCCPIYSHL